MSARPNSAQRGVSVLFIFIITFLAMFSMGSLLFHTLQAIPTDQISIPDNDKMIKALLVMVDDLNAPQPNIDSLWAISIDTNINEIHFLEMTNGENWDALAASFSLSSEAKLSPAFIENAKSIIKNPEGYILLDRLGANAILVSQFPEIGAPSSTIISSGQMEAFCMTLNHPDKMRPLRLGQLFEDQHIAVNFHSKSSARLWEAFILPQEQRTCSIRSAVR